MKNKQRCGYFNSKASYEVENTEIVKPKNINNEWAKLQKA